jgi:hypothetical protein
MERVIVHINAQSRIASRNEFGTVTKVLFQFGIGALFVSAAWI